MLSPDLSKLERQGRKLKSSVSGRERHGGSASEAL